MRLMKTFFFATVLFLGCPSWALCNFLMDADQLTAEGANFTWEEARSKTIKIFVESVDQEKNARRADLGSGFLISPDGLFVTAYHVMKYCLQSEKGESRFATRVDCSTANPVLRYKAQIGDHVHGIEILSFGKETDSVNGRSTQSPDETIKHRDFVIGRLTGGRNVRFSCWKLADFPAGAINLKDPRADFDLVPLRPPKKVFIVGYPNGRLVIAHGFLNLTESHQRGYFATDLNLYSPEYLKRHGISPDTEWGIRVENHMSGGVVIDPSGYVVGLVVNGANRTTGVLSIENVLETFFSRSEPSGANEGVILNPTRTPLYLKTTTKS